MADKLLTNFNAIGGDVGDGFTDLLPYGDPDAGATADRDLKVTPFELFVRRTRKYTHFWDDLYTVNMVGQNTSGTGQVNQSNQSTTSHPGVVEVKTGTDTTGAGGVSSNNVYAFRQGGGRIWFLSYFKTPSALSDGTNRYSLFSGLTRQSLVYAPTECIAWRYVDNVNSGNWQLTCRNSSTESVSDSGTAVAADTWYRLEIDINAAGNSVTGYVNGTAASGGAITTNIPTAESFYQAFILKSLGTTDRAAYVDGYGWLQNLTTAR